MPLKLYKVVIECCRFDNIEDRLYKIADNLGSVLIVFAQPTGYENYVMTFSRPEMAAVAVTRIWHDLSIETEVRSFIQGEKMTDEEIAVDFGGRNVLFCRGRLCVECSFKRRCREEFGDEWMTDDELNTLGRPTDNFDDSLADRFLSEPTLL